MSEQQKVRITRAAAKSAPVPPEQKRFNQLISRIERARERLHAWQQAMPPFRQAYTEQVLPLVAREKRAQRDWLLALDRTSTQRKWSRADAKTLTGLIYEQALQQLNEHSDDLELLAIFERAAGQDYASHQRNDAELAKVLFEAATGVDLGDGPFATDAAVFERIDEHVRREAEAEAEHTDDDPDWLHDRAAHADAAGRSRASAKETKRQAELARVSQSIRDIYRKLVSALHPDREPDAARRQAKTALMQKVNAAYEQNDLLTLLETQLQLEQLDLAALNGLDRATLKRYNSVLADQLLQLEQELDHEEMRFVAEYGIGEDQRLEPQRLGALVEQTCKRIRASIAQFAKHVEWLRVPNDARGWLKAVREEERAWQRHMRTHRNDLFDELF